MPAKILVVEDDPDVRMLVSSVLSKWYEVRTATNGFEALTTIEAGFKPDLIVADIMMPELDGITMTKALKHQPSTSQIPVIFLTARTTPRDVVEGINVGAKAYLTKPFKVDELVSKVAKLLPKPGK
ncbi:MAG: response regulator [Myxococcota bacterium]|nr:response regulator [Myxococcota bacterium]